MRAICASAGAHLVPGAWLLLEHGYDQAEACRALFAAQGFAEVQSWPDLAGIVRVSGGRAAAADLR
jgi:release factor glutamine methyltransferase